MLRLKYVPLNCRYGDTRESDCVGLLMCMCLVFKKDSHQFRGRHFVSGHVQDLFNDSICILFWDIIQDNLYSFDVQIFNPFRLVATIRIN